MTKIERALRKALGTRRPDSHKGDYGRVFILAGSRGMSGACFLAGMAALRSGAGLVTVGIPKSLGLALARRIQEVMTLELPETSAGTLGLRAFGVIKRFIRTQDVLALGPGLSLNPATQSLIRKTVLYSTKPMVLDADGLNAFKGKTAMFRRLSTPVILTPHTGEFIRLFGGKIPRSQMERKRRAHQMAKRHGVVLVLKGHRTVVASPRGELYTNRTGNPGMATGGSGDVLTGVIAGLWGQGLDGFQAACFGVYVHGLAGDLAARRKGQISLVAGDLLDALPRAFKRTVG